MKHLIDRVDSHEPVEFIAPIMAKHSKLFVVQDGIPYWFMNRVRKQLPDFYLLNPIKDECRATIVRAAQPHEFIPYLRALPSIPVIALYPIGDRTWLAMPFNLSDASQRGWKRGELRTLSIVHENINPTTTVQARILGDSLLYERVTHMQGHYREYSIAESIIAQRITTLRLEEEKSARAAMLKTEKGRLRSSLEFMGATLEDWTREIDGYTVRWQIDGQEYRMQIDTEMRVKSAGVCLSGTDDWHSLASVVDVMQERRKAIDDNRHGDW